MQRIKHLVLGITGGIAAYKAAELTRLLVKNGVSVQVVMTDAAGHFITPVTMQALSGRAVHSKMWDASIPNGMPHIELSREADVILVAPASADFMAKLANGQADDLLSTLCLARDCPLLIAPAMNKQMWESPATQRNVAQLSKDGVMILGPDAGEQACGEVGMGRMLEPEVLFNELLRQLNAQIPERPLAGKRILITAGPTVEQIDPVRAITNFSSGKMGYSIAEAAIEMGAEVTLVSGPTQLSAPTAAKVIQVKSAEQMLSAVMTNIEAQDIFIAVAAVADYRPAKVSEQKIKKTDESISIDLVPNEDILAKVANLSKPPFCVGFAAESENLLVYAEQKRQRKKIPLIAANLASEAMGADESALILLDDDGSHPLAKTTKLKLARGLLNHVATMLSAKN
ncbi:MAG: fused 4-phosphopantothenoylcysteine decarboxylase [Pseudomonadota bacterium]|jgi:phosphopantothenoylcysteine decarboxylase / phosphopantothenate---cysteine ligase